MKFRIRSGVFAVQITVPCADIHRNFACIVTLPIHTIWQGVDGRQPIFPDEKFRELTDGAGLDGWLSGPMWPRSLEGP